MQGQAWTTARALALVSIRFVTAANPGPSFTRRLAVDVAPYGFDDDAFES